jgi:tetratricopeptide (TPR) repeat protein
MAFLYLLCLTMYLKFALVNSRIGRDKEKRGRLFFLISISSAILAMYSKQNAFTLPMCVLLMDYFFIGSGNRARLHRSVAFFIALLIIPFTIFITENPELDSVQDSVNSKAGSSEYFLTQFGVISAYIRLLAFPFNQNLDYDFPVWRSFLEGNTIPAIFFLAALAIWSYNKNRIASFGILFFFLTLSVESSFIPLDDLIFEHRLYLPITGLCFSLSCLTGYWTKPIHSIFVHNREMKVRRTFELRHFIAFLIPLIVFGLCAIERNRIWINDLTLWSDSVAKSPRKARPHNNLGKALADRSEWGPAIREYQRAIRADSEYFIAYDNLGVAYASMGLYNKAIPEYKEAIRLNKSYYKAHNNLGTTYFNLGRFVDASKEYEQSLSLKYDYPSSHYNLANTYAATENYDEAIREYKIAIGLNPAFAAAHDNLGLVYSLLNRREEALEEWKRALEIDPGFKAARRGLQTE